MGESDIIRFFPALKDDKHFRISSPENPDYNCIAWAYQLIDDRWMQPPSGMYIPKLDAITWWPNGVLAGMDISCLVDAFKKNSFEDCDSWEHEKGYIKVALYYDPTTNNWTHAARESRSGDHWMSKLGPKNDIEHSTPYTIEGDCYGKVYCILKRADK